MPLQKTPSSALYLPILALEFTEQGQEEAGKGLKIPFCGGSSLHAIPFRQKAAVNLMPIGHGNAVSLLNASSLLRPQRMRLRLQSPAQKGLVRAFQTLS